MRDLRLRAKEIGDQDWLYREEQKRNAWQWENALRRHNFIGFIGEMLKGVVEAKLNDGEDVYGEWVEEAKAKTLTRMQEKQKGGGNAEEAEL